MKLNEQGLDLPVPISRATSPLSSYLRAALSPPALTQSRPSPDLWAYQEACGDPCFSCDNGGSKNTTERGKHP